MTNGGRCFNRSGGNTSGSAALLDLICFSARYSTAIVNGTLIGRRSKNVLFVA